MMALSNWDCLMMNHKGENISTFKSPAGVEVEVYKNWLYIRDKSAWNKKSSFIKPTVMEIQEGNIIYKDTHIYAFRGLQNGVYCVAWSGWEYKNTLKGFIGCGVYGYKGDNYIGVTEKSLKWFMRQLTFQWRKYDVPKIFNKIDLTKGSRFNLGDQFFSEKVGTDKQRTKPGKAKKTVFSQILEK